MGQLVRRGRSTAAPGLGRRLPFGTLPGRMAAAAYMQELTVHGWDLAYATGQTGALDPRLAAASLDVARRIVPAEGRGGPVPLGPVVEVPADADPYRQLTGWLDRDAAGCPQPVSRRAGPARPQPGA